MQKPPQPRYFSQQSSKSDRLLETENMLNERAALADEDTARDVLSRIQHAQIRAGDEV